MAKLVKAGPSAPQQKKQQLPQQLPLPLLDLSFLQLYSHQIRSEGLAAKLGASAFTLFIVMRSFCIVGGKDDGVVKLSLSQMEATTGLSRPTLIKSLKRLEEEKLVRVIHQPGRGTRRFYLMDTFSDRATREPVATVVYKPTEAAKVRAELQRWSEGVGVPSHPSVTLIQVNQITNNTTNNVTVNLSIAPGHDPAEVAPWIDEVIRRVSRSATVAVVKPVDQADKGGQSD